MGGQTNKSCSPEPRDVVAAVRSRGQGERSLPAAPLALWTRRIISGAASLPTQPSHPALLKKRREEQGGSLTKL